MLPFNWPIAINQEYRHMNFMHGIGAMRVMLGAVDSAIAVPHHHRASRAGLHS
jgi:hypothetical protein